MNLKHKELNILLVEDDDVDAMAVQRGFRKLQLEHLITRAQNGREALEILSREAGEEGALAAPFIILLDLNMPIMGGVEFLRELRQNDRLKLSVVFVLTTSEAESDITAAYNENIAGYIVKSNLRNRFVKLVEMINIYGELVTVPTLN